MGTIKTDVVAVGNINLMTELDDTDEAIEDIDPFWEDKHNDDYFDR